MKKQRSAFGTNTERFEEEAREITRHEVGQAQFHVARKFSSHMSQLRSTEQSAFTNGHCHLSEAEDKCLDTQNHLLQAQEFTAYEEGVIQHEGYLKQLIVQEAEDQINRI